jgi:hypothetical protein
MVWSAIAPTQAFTTKASAHSRGALIHHGGGPSWDTVAASEPRDGRNSVKSMASVMSRAFSADKTQV